MAEKKCDMTYDEILLSKEFEAYILGPTIEAKAYWEEKTANNIHLQKEFENALRIHQLLTSHKTPEYPKVLKDTILNKVLSSISNDEGNKLWLRNPYLKIAASIFLVLGLSYLISLFTGNRVVSDNNIIAFNEIIVPSGEKTQVILSDGTKIWLNSESKLKYPALFTGEIRNVYLEGEAYFDVSKVKGSTFLVNTQGVKIEVLGTIFNVKSYPDEETVETSVVEGKVKVDAGSSDKKLEPVYILPSERAVYHKNYDKIVHENTGKKQENEIADKFVNPQVVEPLLVEEVDIKNIISWKDHQLAFTNETFEEIAIKMTRWYKIKVLINDENLKKQRFTGKFVNNETFYQVLEAINLTTPIEYKYDNNEVTVICKEMLHQKKKRPKI